MIGFPENQTPPAMGAFGLQCLALPRMFPQAKIGIDIAELLIKALCRIRRPDPGVGITSVANFLHQGVGDRAAKPLTTKGGRRGNVVDRGAAPGVQQRARGNRSIIQIKLPGAGLLLTNQNDAASTVVMPGNPANSRIYAIMFCCIWRGFSLPERSNGEDAINTLFK